MTMAEQYDDLAEYLHDLFVTIVDREELDVQRGLELLTYFVYQEMRLIHDNLLKAHVPHADGRLWQAIAQITHQLAHAPNGMQRDDVDAWLHPELKSEDDTLVG